MNRLLPAAIALLCTACTSQPDYAWRETEPAFGADQAIAQYAFCGAIFAGLAHVAEDPDGQEALLRLAAATETRITKLGAGPNSTAVGDGLRHAAIYALGADADQIAAAAELCRDVVAMGESR